MQYGQIVFILFILLLLYYAGMIVMDLQQAKAARAAELDEQSEEDIDISDEAGNFNPVQVSRDEPEKGDEKATGEENSPDGTHENGDDETEAGSVKSPEKSEAETEDGSEEENDFGDAASADDLTGQPVRRPGYREVVMTGGVSVETLIEDVDKLVLTGKSDLGAIVFSIINME